MKTGHFEIEVADDVLIVVPGAGMGSLHDEIIGELRGALLDPRIADRPLRGVIVDFEHVDYFGSLLLEALRGLWTELQPLRIPLLLCNVRGVCREIIAVTKFDHLWPMLDSRQAALDEIRHRSAAAPPKG